MAKIKRLSLLHDVLPAIAHTDLMSIPERLTRRGSGIGLITPGWLCAIKGLNSTLRQKLQGRPFVAGHSEIVAIGDPDLLRYIMRLDETSGSFTDRNGEIYNHLRQRGPNGEPGDVLDGGSFSQESSPLWERTRRAAKLTNTRDITQSILEHFTKRLEDQRDAKQIDLLDLLKKSFIYGLSLRLFGSAMQEVGQNRLATYAPEYFERMAWQLMFALMPGNKGLGREKYAKTGKALGSTLEEMIEAARRDPSQFEGSLLGQLLKEFDANDPGEYQVIKGTLGTEVMAGFDSVGVVIAQACRELAKDQSLQAELRQEGEVVAGGNVITPSMWRFLRKTRDFWKLSVHRNPAFRVVFRHVVKQHTLVVKREGLTIRHTVNPGDHLLLVLSAAHHDPAYWAAENMTFKHTQEGWSTRENHAHLPYGVGKRSCMGEALAEQTGPLLIATLLQYCKITLPRLRLPGVAMAMTSPLRSTIFNVEWLKAS